jgi:hypothetical protein
MDYGFAHQGKVYTPNGTVGITDAVAHNTALEGTELDWLKTGPQKLFLYVRHINSPLGIGNPYQITTWPGTVVCESASVGPRCNVGFGYHTYRRAISAVIFGTLYHGWYMESSGDYCRLTRAKVQPKGK